MLTCKQASRLISEANERKLGLRERFVLRLHLWMCDNCRRFEGQMRFLRHTMRKGKQEGRLPTDKSLPPESRERIRQALREHGENRSD